MHPTKHDESDEEILGWELPCSILSLEVSNLKTLSSQLLKSFNSFKFLFIRSFPSSLSDLVLCHLTSLQSLHIEDFPKFTGYLPQLPSSLSGLSIINCPNLYYLSKSALPSSLFIWPSGIGLIFNPFLSQHCPPSSISGLSINALIFNLFW